MDDWLIITLLKWPGQDAAGVLRALGYAPGPVEDELSYDDIGQLEQPGPAIAGCDGWFMLGHPAVQLLGDRAADGVLPEQWHPGLTSMPAGSCAWLLDCAGQTGTFGFTLLEQGIVRRRRLVNVGEILADVGAPLPGELEVMRTASDEGDRLLALLDHSGVSLSRFVDQRFALYDPI